MARPTRRLSYFATAASAIVIVAALLGGLATAIVASRAQEQATLTDRFALRVEYSADFVGGSLSSLTQRARHGGDALPRRRSVPGEAGDRLRRLRLRPLRHRARRHRRGGLGPPSRAHRARGDPGRAALVDDGIRAWGWPSGPAGAHVALSVSFGPPSAQQTLVAALPLAETPVVGFLHHVVTSPRAEVLLAAASGSLITASPPVRGTTIAGYSARLAAGAHHATSGSFADHGPTMRFTSAAVPGTGWRLLVAEPNSVLYAAAGGLEAIVAWIVFALLAILAGALLAMFLRMLGTRQAMQDSFAKMELEASTDPLTGVANRRQLEAVLRRLAKGSEPYSVLMIDLDDFKQVNDRYGHAAGDRVLRQLAELLSRTFRDGDVFGRWGGDEFLAVLPGAGALDAAELAARLQHAARELRSLVPKHTPVPRMTIGTATSGPGSDVVAAADRALYQAKAARRPTTADVGA